MVLNLGEPSSEEEGGGLSKFMTRLLPAGVAAGVFYGLLRLAYMQFYGRLGLLPEDVGLGRAEILTQAIVGPAVIGLLYIATLALVLSGSLYFVRSLNTASLVRGGAACVVLAVFLTFIAISVRADRAGTDVVEKGRSVRTVYLPLAFLKVPLLDIRALPVAVEWKDPSRIPAVIKNGTECMFYLGRAGTRTVLYDVRTKRAIQFEGSEAIVMTSREPKQLDVACSKESGQ